MGLSRTTPARRPRDEINGHFLGRPRVNVEDVPRLSAQTVTAHPASEFFALWASRWADGQASHALKIQRVGATAVVLTSPDGVGRRREIVRQPAPRGGFKPLFRCPGCSKVRGYLYLPALQCQACSGLRFASEGRAPFPARLAAMLGDREGMLAALEHDRRLELSIWRRAFGPPARDAWGPSLVTSNLRVAAQLFQNVRLHDGEG